MTDALSSTVPAGWYPDPWGSASQRWWDGSAWSEKKSAPSDAQPDPEQTQDSPADEYYQPVAVRSTYAPPTRSSDSASGSESPFPSRRALRELAHADEPPVTEVAEPVTADPVPEFTPEPVSALPPPVWTAPQGPDVGPPVATVAPTVTAVIQAGSAPTAPATTAPATPAPETAAAAAAAPSLAPAVAPAFEKASAASAPVPSAPTAMAASVAELDDDWAASLAAWDDVETTSAAPPDALPIFGDAPPVSYSQRAMRYQPLHGRTSPVWLIVFMPLIHGAALVGSLFLFPDALAVYASPASFQPDGATIAAMGEWLMFAAAPLAVAFFLFTFIMGFQDRARLRLLGHDQTASPWWIVLHPLVYLIVRSVRVQQGTGRRGSGPLTTYLCLYVAPPIALAVTTAVISALEGAIPV